MADKGDAGKVSKASVRYSLGGDHCGVCRFIIPGPTRGPSAAAHCEKVAGEVTEDFWCKRFRRARTLAHG